MTADDSELSELPDVEDNDQHDEVEPIAAENDQSTYKDEPTDAEDAIPLTAISATKKHVYRWRKADVMQCSRSFTGAFNDVPEKLLSPLDYFSKFFPDSLLEAIVHQTNLYSVQKVLKSVDTCVDEMESLIQMEILMGIIKLPSYQNCCSRSLCFPAIADAMPRNCYELLRRYIHFVDQDTEHDANDKLQNKTNSRGCTKRMCESRTGGIPFS